MRVGLIGCGRMGSALARAFSQASHEVLATSRPYSLAARRLAEELPGVRALPLCTLVREAPIVVLAVPFRAALDVMGGVVAAAGECRPLVDVTNPAIDDAGRYALPSGGEVLADRLPRWRVVKAFNTVPAALVDTPILDRQPVTVPIASDCDEAKAQVSLLAQELGFDPVDTGGIRRSREIEALAVLLVGISARHGLGGEVGFRLERRALSDGVGRLVQQQRHAGGIAVGREPRA